MGPEEVGVYAEDILRAAEGFYQVLKRRLILLLHSRCWHDLRAIHIYGNELDGPSTDHRRKLVRRSAIGFVSRAEKGWESNFVIQE